MSSPATLTLSRRGFLAATAGAGGLILGFSLPGFARELQATASADGANFNAFVAIDAQGIVTMQMPFIEMGQGTYTALPMLIAEELDVDLSAVRPVQAGPGADYRIMFNNSIRFTGDSRSVRSSWVPLRTAGAAARSMLISAAAERWGVDVASLRTGEGFVLNPGNGEKLGYGELASLAARLTPPDDVVLKDPSLYKLLGKPLDRTDVIAKTNGSAEYGFDFQMDGLRTAVVKQSPVHRGNVTAYKAEAALKFPGVFSVDEIPHGIAVVGKSYWHAKRALDVLEVEFDQGEMKDFNSGEYASKLLSRVREPGVHAENKGDVDAALEDADLVIEASYELPYLAHVTMEPMCSTALVADNKCTVWTPNQGVDYVVQTAAQITGISPENITVHTPYLGGGFGRRFQTDFVAQAVTLAMKHEGTPIKVLWSREEDMQHDFYRPMLAAHYRAAFDREHNPTAVFITNVGDGPWRQLAPEFMSSPDLDNSVMEGTIHQPYGIANWRADYVYEHSPAPIGFWRSVSNSYNGFCKESFIDEMAHATARDPVEFRRDMLVNDPRHLAILNRAVEMAQWRSSSWQADDRRTHAMGVALHKSFGTIVAQIAEISLDRAGLLQVHKVWCAVDCGFTVNPRIATMQMESAIAFGLSAMLHEEISIKDGATTAGNFDDYPILTVQQMPDIEVAFINGGGVVGGIGEAGTPPIAPAVCNALFALNGQRIRSLPLRKHNLA